MTMLLLIIRNYSRRMTGFLPANWIFIRFFDTGSWSHGGARSPWPRKMINSGSARRRIVSDAWLAARRDEHARTCGMCVDVRESGRESCERGEREMCVWEFWKSWCTVVNKCTERYIPCWWKLTVCDITRSDSSEHTVPNTSFRSVTHGA